MDKAELGHKRQCLECSTKFFDLNRSPITCPKCGTVLHIAPLSSRTLARSASGEGSASEVGVVAASLLGLEETRAEVLLPVIDEDVEIDEDDTTMDDSFLEEEEEESDDVSGLIDGDIRHEDEL